MNSSGDLVTIVVPIYNSEKYLVECLESIVSQSYSNLEIILIDDGSSDGSANICINFTKFDSRIKYYYQENRGVSAARNKGLRLAAGKYITFIDSDDTINRCFIHDLYFGMVKYEANIATTAVLDVDSSTSNILKQKPKSAELLVLSKFETLMELYKGTLEGTRNGIQMTEVKILKKHKIKYDEEMAIGEDFDFFARSVMASNRVLIDRKKMYYYRSNPSSAMMQDFNVGHFEAIKNVEKVGRRYQKRIPGLKELVDVMVFSDCIYYGAKMVRDKSLWPDEYLEIKKMIKQYRFQALTGAAVKKNIRIKACLVYVLGISPGLKVARRLIRW